MIPYARQSIDEDDVRAVAEVLRSDFLTGGPAVDRFEAALGETVGCPHVVACSSGTAALHLAMLALRLGPGDAVVVPSITFLASANAVKYVGADVRFADVDPDTGLMTPETLQQALNADGPGLIRAVVVVHLNGQSVDMQGIAAVARERGLFVVEDACHALGGASVLDGRRHPVGSAVASDLACFSFHPAKVIAMGEGGAVTTRDPDLAERVRRLRNHGMVRNPADFSERAQAFDAEGMPNPWYYEMPEPGFNYRASDIHCALGESQLRKLSTFLARRRELAALYDEALAPLAPLVRPVPRGPSEHDGWHLYVVLIDFARAGRSRAEVMRSVRDAGIGTQVHYLPVHRQPYYRTADRELTLSGADTYYERCLSLPMHCDLQETEIWRMIMVLRDTLA
ncbi:MAG: UDP-4-amino-4,6-dideoxy-N-acetyl-beta-L-altrosamine transaminase [Rhodospirillales bacterium]|nr:MAG: UDP-4-amino-4,6-dideoxy-N-acetyl-beta-L-altrosamine transaminase [Rhodospirillales bacterium]